MYIPYGRLAGIAHIYGDEKAPELSGTVKFYLADGGVLVVAEVSGLPETPTGIFAFHIHEGSACTGKDFADTKGHYDPTNQPHPMHAGDLPPLFSVNGRAFLAVLTGRFKFSEVIGRTVIIHDNPDGFTAQPSGNSGVKIGCGLIRAV